MKTELWIIKWDKEREKWAASSEEHPNANIFEKTPGECLHYLPRSAGFDKSAVFTVTIERRDETLQTIERRDETLQTFNRDQAFKILSQDLRECLSYQSELSKLHSYPEDCIIRGVEAFLERGYGHTGLSGFQIGGHKHGEHSSIHISKFNCCDQREKFLNTPCICWTRKGPDEFTRRLHLPYQGGHPKS